MSTEEKAAPACKCCAVNEAPRDVEAATGPDSLCDGCRDYCSAED